MDTQDQNRSEYHSKYITIFEGPNGSGKTVAARKFADLTGARYVHFSDYLEVTKQGSPRMYLEEMLPAIYGFRDVVIDRCWLSDNPYADVLGHHPRRISAGARRMLERVAMRCGAVVVRCQPSWEVVTDNYLARQRDCPVKKIEELKKIYHAYATQPNYLNEYIYDYKCDYQLSPSVINEMRLSAHPLVWQTVGRYDAPFLVIVPPQEPTDYDLHYTAAGVCFDLNGGWMRLAEQLEAVCVSERHFCWINSDKLDKQLLSRNWLAIFNFQEEHKEMPSLLKSATTRIEHFPAPYDWFLTIKSERQHHPFVREVLRLLHDKWNYENQALKRGGDTCE